MAQKRLPLTVTNAVTFMMVVLLVAQIQNANQNPLVGCEFMSIFRKNKEEKGEDNLTIETVNSLISKSSEENALILKGILDNLKETIIRDINDTTIRLVDSKVNTLDINIGNRIDSLTTLFRMVLFSLPPIQVYLKALKEFRVNTSCLTFTRLEFVDNSDYEVEAKIYCKLSGYTDFIKNQQAKKIHNEPSIFDILNKHELKYFTNEEELIFFTHIPW